MANKIATDGPAGFNHTRTYVAQAALTRGFGVVQGTADNQANTPAAAAARCLGVASENAAIGDATQIVTSGEAIAIAGGAVVAGDIVKMDANGKFVAGNAADVETAGKALTSAAADTDQFVIFVAPNQKRS